MQTHDTILSYSGDKDENQQLTSHQCSFKNPSTSFKALRFDTLADSSLQVYNSTFKYKARDDFLPEHYTSTSFQDYTKKDCNKTMFIFTNTFLCCFWSSGRPASSKGSQWTRGASCLPAGDLDSSRVHKRLNYTTKGSYITVCGVCLLGVDKGRLGDPQCLTCFQSCGPK